MLEYAAHVKIREYAGLIKRISMLITQGAEIIRRIRMRSGEDAWACALAYEYVQVWDHACSAYIDISPCF